MTFLRIKSIYESSLTSKDNIPGPTGLLYSIQFNSILLNFQSTVVELWKALDLACGVGLAASPD